MYLLSIHIKYYNSIQATEQLYITIHKRNKQWPLSVSLTHFKSNKFFQSNYFNFIFGSSPVQFCSLAGIPDRPAFVGVQQPGGETVDRCGV